MRTLRVYVARNSWKGLCVRNKIVYDIDEISEDTRTYNTAYLYLYVHHNIIYVRYTSRIHPCIIFQLAPYTAFYETNYKNYYAASLSDIIYFLLRMHRQNAKSWRCVVV